LISDLLQDGFEFLEYLLRAADPDGELAALRALRPAAHGRVEKMHLAPGELAVNPPYRPR
jgi:hypothetical protein